MKKIIILSIALISLFSCTSNKKSSKEIAIVFPVTIDAFEQLKDGFRTAISDKFDYRFYSAEGDPAKFETVIQSALLNNPEYLVTVGTQMTNTAFSPKFESRLNTVIASAISSPEKVDALIRVGIAPPRSKSVAIISDSPKEDEYTLLNKLIQTTLPEVRKVGVIFNNAEINSKYTAGRVKESLRSINIEVVEGIITGLDDVEKIINKLLLDKVNAVLIPHDKYAVTKARAIVKKCLEKNIPVLSLDDGTVKRDGVAIGVSVNYEKIGRQIAETIIQIANDSVKANLLPVIQSDKASIYINQESIKALGINTDNILDNSIVY
jgi:putative tryptophan/tyrosine transport system substrate-binding protein